MVSSGLRVGMAADNAAYWSISTTMHSDRMAVSAVSDALGLGAAKVDVAYAATSSIVDILVAVKSRLVAAQEEGVDRSKIQQEIEQLKDQAVAVTTAASFNGVNYLKTSEPHSLHEIGTLETRVASSFVRSSDGTVAVKQTAIDLKITSMLNDGGGGILQKEATGGMAPFAPVVPDNFYHDGHEDHSFPASVTFGAGQTVTFDLALDYSPNGPGMDHSIVIDKSVVDAALGTTDGIVPNVAAMVLVFQEAFANAGAAVTAAINGMRYDLRSAQTSGTGGSSVYITNLASTLAGGEFLGLDTDSAYDHDNMHPKATLDFPGQITMVADSIIEFDARVAGVITTVSIDRATVDAALGTSDGVISSAAQLAAIINHVPGTGISASDNGSRVVLVVDQTMHPGYGGLAASLQVSDFMTNLTAGIAFDLAEINVAADDFSIPQYLDGVERMLNKSVASAATLGAIQSRIAMQTEFTAKMMSAIDKGVGRLVDADMNEASTRLKAIQSQQQLAIQSLSIANTSAENVMQLFR
jgi:flagellin